MNALWEAKNQGTLRVAGRGLAENANLQRRSDQNPRFCPKRSRFDTAEGVTCQKPGPARDNMPALSTDSCQWREVTQMHSSETQGAASSTECTRNTKVFWSAVRSTFSTVSDFIVVATRENRVKHMHAR